jgi:phage terminase large subunit-like protein
MPSTPRPGAHVAVPALSRADAVMAFCEDLTITSGSLAGTKLVLRPWQRDFIRQVYATDDAGRRTARVGLLSLGRKAGKTGLAAALALCHLTGPEAVSRGQVVSAAADRPQARLIMSEMRAFAEAHPDLSRRIVWREFNGTAECDLTGSTFLTCSSDHRKAAGLSPVVAICEELAQWRSRDLLDALRTGQGAHAEPLLLAVSTRSPLEDSPLEELIKYAETGDDPTVVSAIYSAPLDADPFAETTWRLANPDATPERIADIAAQAAQAQRLPSTMPAFRAYCLNQPVSVADQRWISGADWDACRDDAQPEGPCFAGLDLSAGGAADLCAFSLYWPNSGLLRCWGFLASAQIEPKTRADAAPYPTWIAQGHVVVLSGRTIDRSLLLAWIAEQVSGLDLRGIASDRWMLADLQATAEREGIELPWMPHGAGFRDMAPALQAFEREVMEGRLRHGGNGLLRFAVSNVAIDLDAAGNRKPTKQRSIGRIDPAIAAILAVSAAGKEPAEQAFEYTGLLI